MSSGNTSDESGESSTGATHVVIDLTREDDDPAEQDFVEDALQRVQNLLSRTGNILSAQSRPFVPYQSTARAAARTARNALRSTRTARTTHQSARTARTARTTHQTTQTTQTSAPVQEASVQEGGEVRRGVRRGGGDATEQTGARFENPGTLAVPVDDIFGNLMSQEAAEQFEIELNEDATFLINIVDAICKYDGTIFGGDGLVCMFLTEGGVRRGTERFLRRLESLNRREFTICCRMSVQASTFFKRDFNHSIVEDSSSTPTFSLCTPFGVEINVGLNHFPQHDLLLTTQDLLSMSRHGLHVREANLLSNLPNPFLTLCRSIECKRFRWLATARQTFSISAGSRQFMHMRWSTLMKEGVYNSDHRWNLMYGPNLATFLCSGGSCCLCLGEEDDPLLAEKLQPQESDAVSDAGSDPDYAKAKKEEAHTSLKKWLTTTDEGQRVCRKYLCLPCSREHIFHVQCFSRIQMNIDGDVLCPLCRAPYSIFEL